MTLYTFHELAHCPKFGPAALVEIVGAVPRDIRMLYRVRKATSHDTWQPTRVVAEGEAGTSRFLLKARKP